MDTIQVACRTRERVMKILVAAFLYSAGNVFALNFRLVGLTNVIFTNWKYKGSKSYMNYIDKIAECLGVSKTYLINGEDEQMNRDNITKYEVEKCYVDWMIENESFLTRR